MFIVDEKVVYPGHGVATIRRIIEKKVAGQCTQFYELEVVNKGMTILVPLDGVEASGIRKLSTMDNINEMLILLAESTQKPVHETIAANWNKRNKEYQGKIRTGSLREICLIYRDLKHIAEQKELSFGEKSLLDQTELLLAEELALVTLSGEEKAIERLRAVSAPAKIPTHDNIFQGSLTKSATYNITP